MRNYFDKQLDRLHIELIQMGALCEEAISAAAKALLTQDSEMADRARQAEIEIDRAEGDVERLCLQLLLRQQPVAKDLRQVSAALKMISDLERIGDQAADIAELSGYLSACGEVGKTHIGDMARATVAMVTDSIDSFVKKDLKLAQEVCKSDDIVDELFASVKKEMIELISQDGSKGELALDILMVAKYFERIGDHATNVAEWVEYSITGIHADNN